MLAWLKQLFSTDTSLLIEERRHSRQLQKLLADSLKDSQSLNRKLTDTLDRVVQSRFDPPIKPQPMEQPRSIPFPDLSDMLSVEDDGAFIETMEKMNA